MNYEKSTLEKIDGGVFYTINSVEINKDGIKTNVINIFDEVQERDSKFNDLEDSIWKI